MPENNHPDRSLDEKDLKRAEKNTEKEVPLAATEEDAQVPDTELRNPTERAKESGRKNDPTSDRSPTS